MEVATKNHLTVSFCY